MDNTMQRILSLRFNWREKVKVYLKRTGITMEDVGAELGVTKPRVCSVLNGKETPGDKVNMETICAAIAQIEGRRKEDG